VDRKDTLAVFALAAERETCARFATGAPEFSLVVREVLAVGAGTWAGAGAGVIGVGAGAGTGARGADVDCQETVGGCVGAGMTSRDRTRRFETVGTIER
jgi:hypothetical protein